VINLIPQPFSLLGLHLNPIKNVLTTGWNQSFHLERKAFPERLLKVIGHFKIFIDTLSESQYTISVKSGY
jgi:hypothetical protein